MTARDLAGLRRPGVFRLALVVCSWASLAAAQADDPAHMARRDPAGVFDKPLLVRVAPAPPPARHPDVKASLACFSYSDFLVKELDYHEKGAERLSLAPTAGAPADVPCDTAALPGEKTVTDASGGPWSGYFQGVKGRFAVFDGDDAVDDSVAFVVVEGATGKTVFSDSAREIVALEAKGDGLTLHFRRGFHAPCSLVAEPDACWRRIQEETRLSDAQRPDCAPYYAVLFAQADMMAESRQRLTKDILKELAADPSFLVYDATAEIRGGAATLTPGDGPALCRPAI